MKIALIGYGKMGKTIEKVAQSRGHEITQIIDSKTPITRLEEGKSEVAIEFTQPELAVQHIQGCLDRNLPIVVGTTAWLERLPEVEQRVKNQNGSLFYASNFSLGVALFNALTNHLGALFSAYPNYRFSMEEIHHTEKLDAPSGTAITLAETILGAHKNYSQWTLVQGDEALEPRTLPIHALRIPNVPGTHKISVESSVDTITLEHKAHNREGFALGAVIAAEFLANKKGIFTMNDLLKINP
ncbi:MAG: 4-hydroxy-tetrahydrodipicolinate reductase [Flavobacteriales bacterium]